MKDQQTVPEARLSLEDAIECSGTIMRVHHISDYERTCIDRFESAVRADERHRAERPA